MPPGVAWLSARTARAARRRCSAALVLSSIFISEWGFASRLRWRCGAVDSATVLARANFCGHTAGYCGAACACRCHSLAALAATPRVKIIRRSCAVVRARALPVRRVVRALVNVACVATCCAAASPTYAALPQCVVGGQAACRCRCCSSGVCWGARQLPVLFFVARYVWFAC